MISERCMCGALDCPSCGPAQGVAERHIGRVRISAADFDSYEDFEEACEQSDADYEDYCERKREAQFDWILDGEGEECE